MFKHRINIKGDKLFIFICDSVFLFDTNKKLMSVPGAAGASGNHKSNGSMTTELQHSNQFIRARGNQLWNVGYGKRILWIHYQFILFLRCRVCPEWIQY